MKILLQLSTWLSALGTISILQGIVGGLPAQAGDPFRSQNPHPIGQNTEAAFKAIFIGGDYPQAHTYLQQAQKIEGNDPLVYAMLASLAYIEQNWETFGEYGTQTRKIAEKLTAQNPLRGNLYLGVGHFLEGAYTLNKQGLIRGVPQALNKLQEVLKFIQKAEEISPQDPELNLIKGYMDLMLSANLPFADPQAAINRLKTLASPQYLTYRGIAMAYRDLKDYPNALKFVNVALESTPNHPEIHYLKAQILIQVGQTQEAQNFFNTALARPHILPKYLVAQMFFEFCQNQRKIDQKPRNCDALRDPIKESNQLWGPAILPSLN